MNSGPKLILIGIGANLPSPEFGSPRATCEAAVEEIAGAGLTILQCSNWYKSAPVPVSSQPWFINGVLSVETSLKPTELIVLLHDVEECFGRVRGVKNAARTLDLDLIAYADTVIGWENGSHGSLKIPHPRMNERAFVLLPLQEIAPDWRHPALNLSLKEMIAGLDPAQQTVLDGNAGENA